MSAPPRPSSPLKRVAAGSRGTFDDLLKNALNGSKRSAGLTLNRNDAAFIKQLSIAFSETMPPKTLDEVGFTFSDRIAAWFSGFGRELRQVKEMQLEDPVGPDGNAPTPSRLTKLQRTALVLVGAEDTANRDETAADSDRRALSSPGLIRKMTDSLIRKMADMLMAKGALSEAAAPSAHGRSRSKTSAQDVMRKVASISEDHDLSCFERLYLNFTREFTDEEKGLLLGRTTGASNLARAASDEGARAGGGAQIELALSSVCAANMSCSVIDESTRRPSSATVSAPGSPLNLRESRAFSTHL